MAEILRRASLRTFDIVVDECAFDKSLGDGHFVVLTFTYPVAADSDHEFVSRDLPLGVRFREVDKPKDLKVSDEYYFRHDKPVCIYHNGGRFEMNAPTGVGGNPDTDVTRLQEESGLIREMIATKPAPELLADHPVFIALRDGTL